MKLYYAPGASSLSPHIALREAGLGFELERVDLRTKKTAHDADYLRINPSGYVPALQFDDGSVLTEGAAIMQWIADQAPDSGLAPAPGTMARYRLVQWLNFIAAELHKTFDWLFNPAAHDEFKSAARERLGRRLPAVAAPFGKQPFLLGETFTVADAYLFTVLSWSRHVQVDLGAWPALPAYLARVGERPKVREAIAAEKVASA
jgi:glutathione S-transferase